MKAPGTTRSCSHARRLATWLILFLAGCGLAGCGPTHTAGTSGMAVKDLSILSIAQLPEKTHLQIKKVQFDGAGEEYEIGNSRDFYLLPGDHNASFTLIAIVPSDIGMLAWLVPKDALTLSPLKDIPLGRMTAGKTYELSPPSEGFDKILQTSQISLIREKPK